MRRIACMAALVCLGVLQFAGTVHAQEFDDYITRHVTLWYRGEDEFIRIEDAFRDSPRPLVGRYGPEEDFLAERMEEVYERVSGTLDIDPRDFRVNVELASNANTTDRPPAGNADVRMAYPEGMYDPLSGTIYLDSAEFSPRSLGVGLAVALLYEEYGFTPPGGLLDAATRTVHESLDGPVR